MNRSLLVRLAVTGGLALLLLIPFALVAVLIVGGWGPLHDLDRSVTDAQHAVALQHPAWVRCMEIWSFVFSPNGFRLAALAVVVVLWRRGAKRLVLWIVVTTAVGGVLGALLKLLVGRDRPDLLDPVARATGYSFPSGHALNAALICGTLLLAGLSYTPGRPGVRTAMWLAAIVLPLVTGYSRIVLGVHWTSDVLGGWLLGAAVVTATAVAFRAWRVERGRPDVPVTAEGVEPEAAGQA